MKSQNNKILRLDEYIAECEIHEGAYCMSEKAKALLKEACEACLIKEGEEFDHDEHEAHTYESYMNECSSYLREMMGNRGYTDLSKHYKR
jgi:hypothetical protein